VSDGPVRRRRPAGVNLTPLGVARAPGPLTLAEFDDALLADQARTAAVVRLMALGRSARRALRELGMPCTGAEVRWAQRSFARAQQGGGLHDRRRDRRGERAGARTVMTAAMEVLVLNHWSSRPTISAATVRQLVVETVVGLAAAAATRGEPFAMRVPSRKTIVAFVGALPPAVRLARARGVERWLKEGAPKALYEPARAGNEYHQIDHTPLDVVVRVLVAATWIPVRPFLTLILDVYSRAVMGFTVSLQGPDAFTTAHALRSAILPKAARDDVFGTGALRGLPLFVTPDHGKDFESHAVAISMRALGIGLEFCPPHYPDMKAEIERLFRSINEGFCARWPGYTKADGSSAGAVAKRIDQLLTMRQLIRELARWIDEYNTTVPDGATESPLDRWLRSARIVEPRPRDLDVLLLKADATRVVTNRGIRFTPPGAPRGTYWAPELPAHWRREVTIRYNPDDLESVLVFDAATGRFVCEAWLTDVPGARYDHADIKRVRLELYRRLVGLRTEGRRALKERMAEYWAEAEAEGRDARRRSGAEWAEMRQIADEVAAAAPSGPDGASGARRRPAAGTRGGEVDASVDALVDALQQPLRLLPPPAPAAPVDDIDALLEELSRPAPVGDVAARDAGDRRIAPTRGTGPAPEEEPGP
jgi:putative transposase